jgi:hypothetical protein
VACGVMGYGGNKGAAAISFSLFRRRVVLVSSHFAAHQVGNSCQRHWVCLEGRVQPGRAEIRSHLQHIASSLGVKCVAWSNVLWLAHMG